MADVPAAMTAVDLEQWPRDHRRYELVRGELIEMPPVGFEHGDVTAGLVTPMRAHADRHRLGKVLIELGYVLARDPDTVRAPDISFVAASRLPGLTAPRGFFVGAPDLAVEVVSPGDTAAEVDDKVQTYLAAGTRLVLIVHPRTRTVTAYRPDGTARVLQTSDILDFGALLPGLSIRVADIFPA